MRESLVNVGKTNDARIASGELRLASITQKY